MAIDFTFSPEVDEVRFRVRDFMQQEVEPRMERAEAEGGTRKEYIAAIAELRPRAQELGIWLPHMPGEYGGMGLGATALAAVSAEAAKVSIGPIGIHPS